MTTSREELPKHAAACALETGVEVTEDGETVSEVRALGKTATEAYYLAKSYCHFMKRHGA